MKPQISSEFIRGALFIYLLNEAWGFGYRVWRAIAEPRVFDIVWYGLFFIPAVLLCWGLLFRPAKSATLVLAFVVVLFVQLAGGAGLMLWAQHSQPIIQTFSFPLSFAQLLASVLIGLFFVGLAFIYRRLVYSDCVPA